VTTKSTMKIPPRTIENVIDDVIRFTKEYATAKPNEIVYLDGRINELRSEAVELASKNKVMEEMLDKLRDIENQADSLSIDARDVVDDFKKMIGGGK